MSVYVARLRALRLRGMFSQMQVARYLRVHHSLVSRWERPMERPSGRLACRPVPERYMDDLADLLGCSVEELRS